MRVAIFTDNDFANVNGLTTTLRAVLAHAPASLDLRVYTCETAGTESDDYLALASRGIGIPYYRDMKMYWPPFRRFLRHAAADGIELVHAPRRGPSAWPPCGWRAGSTCAWSAAFTPISLSTRECSAGRGD